MLERVKTHSSFRVPEDGPSLLLTNFWSKYHWSSLQTDRLLCHSQLSVGQLSLET